MKVRLSRLAWLLALSTLLAGLLGIVSTYRVADAEFRELIEEDLQQQSRVLARLLAATDGGLSPARLEQLLRDGFREDDEDTLLVNVIDLDQRRLVSNLGQPPWPQRHDSTGIRLEFDGHTWFGHQHRHGRLLVQLLRRDDLYRELQEDILEDIITPALLGNGINLLLLALLISLVLWPLSRLVKQLEQRSADSLTPLRVQTPLREIALLGDSLNQLIKDVDEVLGRERRFASDLAHELRTPLATLKLELAGPEPELPVVRAEIDRIARVVEQLLILARLDQGRWQHRFAPLQLDLLCREAITRCRHRAEAGGIELNASLTPAPCRGEATLLGILLDNLLGNCLRHCPAGTGVSLSLQAAAGGWVLEVEDNGPGIPPVLRQHMEAGHTRLDSKSEGLGLGLAICQQIAQAHGARLRFLERHDGQGGLRVRLELPT
ncbi:ATP-binding protein [Zobellella denitrificans]